jgi:hypothetical protein
LSVEGINIWSGTRHQLAGRWVIVRRLVDELNAVFWRCRPDVWRFDHRLSGNFTGLVFEHDPEEERDTGAVGTSLNSAMHKVCRTAALSSLSPAIGRM